MTNKVYYSQEWHVVCPGCQSPLTLTRKQDKPNELPFSVCANCGRSIVGLIWDMKPHVIDLLLDDKVEIL